MASSSRPPFVEKIDKTKSSLEALAAEIERDYVLRSEVVEAQSKGAHHIMAMWAHSKGRPMNVGETITQYLDRWYVPKAVDPHGTPWAVEDECEYLDEQCEVAGFTGNDNMVIFDIEEETWTLVPVRMVSRRAANESSTKKLSGLVNLRDRLIYLSNQPGEDGSFLCDQIADCAVFLDSIMAGDA